MDYPDPEHLDSHYPSEGQAYPDLDESIHYPWQGQGAQQPAQAEASLHSMIDPRLYKDLFSASASQLPDQSLDDDEEIHQYGEEVYPHLDDSDEDGNYEYSSQESSEYVFIAPDFFFYFFHILFG